MGRGDAATFWCPGRGPAAAGPGGSREGDAGHRLMSVTSVGVLVGWLAGYAAVLAVLYSCWVWDACFRLSAKAASICS